MKTDLVPFDQSLINKLETWEEFVSLGQVVRSWKDASSWFLGDLSRRLEIKYGDGSLRKFALDINEKPKSLMEYRRVASRYPKRGDRIAYLSFTHHQRALKSPEPLKLLEMAHDNNWSVRQMERHMAIEETKDCDHDWREYLICSKCGRKERYPLDK